MNVKTIKKNMKKVDLLYNTTIGSIICTIGINTGRSIKECRELFRELKKQSDKLPNTIESLVDYIWTIFGNNEDKSIRSSFVLLTDDKNIRSPMVTFVNDDGNIMPINPKGFCDINLITLAAEGRDWIECEFIFDEDGNIIGEN